MPFGSFPSCYILLQVFTNSDNKRNKIKYIFTLDIKKIIKVGFQTQTNDHMRDWHYIVIKYKNTVIKLFDIIPKGIANEDMKQYKMLTDAFLEII